MKTVDAEVGSDLWIYLHIGKVSGHGFKKILAKGNGKTRASYLKQLITERQTGISSMPCQEVLQNNRGALLEPEFISRYESGWDIEETGKVVIINDDIVLSPDILNCNLFEERRSGAEIKCYGIDKHNKLDGMFPGDKAQVQGYIGYMEAEFWDYILGHPEAEEEYKCFRVQPDQEYIDNLKNEVTRFVEELKTGADLEGKLKESIEEEK